MQPFSRVPRTHMRSAPACVGHHLPRGVKMQEVRSPGGGYPPLLMLFEGGACGGQELDRVDRGNVESNYWL